MSIRRCFSTLLATAIVVALVVHGIGAPTPVTAQEEQTGYLQVAHLAPFAEDASVTIALNGDPALEGVAFGDSTEYIPLPAGDYLVEIFPTGTATAAISANITIAHDTYYSAIAYGDGANQPLALVLLEDDLTAPAAGNFKLRLGHLAPFASGPATADVRLADGTPVLEDVEFGDVTGFLVLEAGTYDLIITTPGGDTTLLNPAPVTFAEGDIVSAYVAGDGANQDLGVFALPAGELGSFLPPKAPNLYLPLIFGDGTS